MVETIRNEPVSWPGKVRGGFLKVETWVYRNLSGQQEEYAKQGGMNASMSKKSLHSGNEELVFPELQWQQIGERVALTKHSFHVPAPFAVGVLDKKSGYCFPTTA